MVYSAKNKIKNGFKQPTTANVPMYQPNKAQSVNVATAGVNAASTTGQNPIDDYWQKNKSAVDTWFGENKDQYDPLGYSYLQNQWNQNRVDPRSFVDTHSFYQDGGLSGWLGKDENFTGTDYIYNTKTGQWQNRNRGAGFELDGYSFANPQQANNKLSDLQRKINDIDNDNKRLKKDMGNFGGMFHSDTIKKNEDAVNELRKEYDKISGLMPQLELGPLADMLLNNYFSKIENDRITGKDDPNSQFYEDPLTDEVYSDWQDQLTDLLGDELTNEYGPEVMSLLREQLDPSFQRGRERRIAQTAAQGRIGGGLEARNLSDLSSTLTSELMKEGSVFADQTADAALNSQLQDYQEKMSEYLDSLKTTYGNEIGDLNKVFQGSEEEINNQIKEWAQDFGIEADAEITDLGINTQDYLNTVNNIGSLLESGAYLGAQFFPNGESENTSDMTTDVPRASQYPSGWNADWWKDYYTNG